MNKYITQNPKILGGKPIIKNTRMSVEVILESLAGGMSMEEMLKEYPFLKKEHLQAAIDYAAKIVSKEKSYMFEKASAYTHEIRRRH
ncbi:DUF433 domain-containing protein [Candidatus Daviesbacteria bacterium]|nr:DUF433 domain-containing protein [Candidatus Daviesbacteria bacterium]